MPAYEYELVSTISGAVLGRITLARPVTERDSVAVRRQAVPQRVAIAGTAPDPGAPQNQVLAAYRRIEQRVGNNADFRRRIGHSPAAVKQAWGA
jgi:hypothetical protein